VIIGGQLWKGQAKAPIRTAWPGSIFSKTRKTEAIYGRRYSGVLEEDSSVIKDNVDGSTCSLSNLRSTVRKTSNSVEAKRMNWPSAKLAQRI